MKPKTVLTFVFLLTSIICSSFAQARDIYILNKASKQYLFLGGKKMDIGKATDELQYEAAKEGMNLPINVFFDRNSKLHDVTNLFFVFEKLGFKNIRFFELNESKTSALELDLPSKRQVYKGALNSPKF